MENGIPTGDKVLNWVLRADNRCHHLGIVSPSESPVWLNLSWRRTAADPVSPVGSFPLQLGKLLRQGYIRYEPAGSQGPEVRVRVVLADDGEFYLQTKDNAPRFRLVRNS